MKDFLDKVFKPTEAQKLGKTGVASIIALAELAERGDQSAADELVTLLRTAQARTGGTGCKSGAGSKHVKRQFQSCNASI